MIETSKNTKENLYLEKKDLDDMKTQLTKSRKDNAAMNNRVSIIQSGLENLNTSFLNVEELLEKASMSVKEEEGSHIEDLNAKMADEQKKLTGLVNQLKTSEVLLDAGKQPKDALVLANSIKKKFDESSKKLNTFALYQQTMKQPVAQIPEIAAFNEEFDMRHTIWSIRDSFQTNSFKWYNEPFLQTHNSEKIIEEVD